MGALVQHRAADPSTAALVEEVPPSLQPWDVFQRLAGLRHALFLDSALAHPTLGRYSFLTADPFEWLWARAGRVVASALPHPLEAADPFAVLAERLARCRAEPLPGLPPFQGGAAGLFGYDLCHHLERLPRPRFDEFAVPDLAVGLYDWVVAFDHAAGRAWLISTGLPEVEPRRRRRRAAQRLRAVRRRLHGPPAAPPWAPGAPPRGLAPQWAVPGLEPLRSSFDRAGYLAAVRRAIEYVHAGDCFQVNVAQRLLSPAGLPPVELYRRLRER